MKGKYIFWVAMAVFVIGAFFLFRGGGSVTGNVIGTSAQVLEIPLAQVNEKASYYEYEVDGTIVRFFAVKAADGTVKTAFDACDVCYDRKKGYRQEGDFMICNNCGNRYPIEGLGTENKAGGGCWPGYLPSQVNSESLVFKISDLKKGVYRFK